MTRLAHAWRALGHEQRLATLAALGLFASMFLPWYSKTDTVIVRGAVKGAETSLSAFQAFSFVEAAVLLVSAAVLALMFARGEGRPFQLPGGDGAIVTIAGGWTALLIFYRLLDKPGLQGNDKVTATVGVEWGVFVALLLALGLAYAGGRMRTLEHPARHRRERERRDRMATDRVPASAREAPDDPRPAADTDATVVTPRHAQPRRSTPVPARESGAVHATELDRQAPGRPSSRQRYPPAPGEQLSFEDSPTRQEH